MPFRRCCLEVFWKQVYSSNLQCLQKTPVKEPFIRQVAHQPVPFLQSSLHGNFKYSEKPLRKTCQNMGFFWTVYSSIMTKSKVLSLHGNIRTRGNPYSGIFYAVNYSIEHLRAAFSGEKLWQKQPSDYLLLKTLLCS